MIFDRVNDIRNKAKTQSMAMHSLDGEVVSIGDVVLHVDSLSRQRISLRFVVYFERSSLITFGGNRSMNFQVRMNRGSWSENR